MKYESYEEYDCFGTTSGLKELNRLIYYTLCHITVFYLLQPVESIQYLHALIREPRFEMTVYYYSYLKTKKNKIAKGRLVTGRFIPDET